MSFDVGLPARSTSTLRAAYEAGLPFWQDLDLRLRFVLRTRLTTGKPGTLPADRKVLTPQPAITGPVAVHLTFATTPASGLASFAGRRPIALGTTISIAGRAVPAIAGERVELRWARIGSPLERPGARSRRPPARGLERRRFAGAGRRREPATTSCGRAIASTRPASCPTTPARGCCGSGGRR